MNIAYACLIFAALSPLLLTLAAKAGGQVLGQRYNNRKPREGLAQLDGWPKRANWAQQNSWEALPLILAGVLMATQAGVPQATIDTWALVFVAARVAYVICYLADVHALRSLVWGIGTLACFRLMVAAL
ncbi:MAPEG family protein [Uliginosibacterium sp. H1]|uniref:MAPEG family protein n=1 Tax=Uliginosibacterium sp. H1 TaxID=3114757 RepID=UPI002E179112|nr:MAPEG family protein [Uliginosibacterium sp. H1]